MKDEDREHIKLIAQRHNIEWMDKKKALLTQLKAQNFYALEEFFELGDFVSHSQVEFDPVTMQPKWKGFYLAEDEMETGEEEYFVALHELAHVILEHKQEKMGSEASNRNEIEAWEWAMAHANYEPSDETVETMLNDVSTYTHLQDAIDRGELEDAPETVREMVELEERMAA